jgi:hypothetical protein
MPIVVDSEPGALLVFKIKLEGPPDVRKELHLLEIVRGHLPDLERQIQEKLAKIKLTEPNPDDKDELVLSVDGLCSGEGSIILILLLKAAMVLKAKLAADVVGVPVAAKVAVDVAKNYDAIKKGLRSIASDLQNVVDVFWRGIRPGEQFTGDSVLTTAKMTGERPV